jgi:hypothetical protein
VERHRESELRPGQYDRIPAFEHRHHPSLVLSGAISFEKELQFSRIAPEPEVYLTTPDATIIPACRA